MNRYHCSEFPRFENMRQDTELKQSLLSEASWDAEKFVDLASVLLLAAIQNTYASRHQADKTRLARLIAKGYAPETLAAAFARAWLVDDDCICLPRKSLLDSPLPMALVFFIAVLLFWKTQLSHLHFTPGNLAGFFLTTVLLVLPVLGVSWYVGGLFHGMLLRYFPGIRKTEALPEDYETRAANIISELAASSSFSPAPSTVSSSGLILFNNTPVNTASEQQGAFVSSPSMNHSSVSGPELPHAELKAAPAVFNLALLPPPDAPVVLPAKLDLDGSVYEVSGLSHEARQLVISIHSTDQQIAHLKNRLAITLTARAAFAAGLQSSMGEGNNHLQS
ncbi:DUF6447 family protein [Desulfobotulus mexicanus]|uniref:Uncharacterized protein n=1 Tax=Desulfobotulus mexicanus TaxID=2586642 RepID=A0A5Q4VG14_9BACT|nr:DUF6447 family protein [Desulfobotulus mexicanus]TYT75307.1 hypothetical protein FIM25_06280 [Desulfobotulus mexicanus]